MIGGSVTPIAAQALAASGGLSLVGVYLAVAGVFSLGGLWLVPRQRG